MEIEKIFNGKDLTLCLDGYLDAAVSPDLQRLLDETMDSIDTLTFDFTNLEYVSSAGLRVLLAAQKAMAEKGGMKILHVNEGTMDVLNITGLANVLHVEKA